MNKAIMSKGAIRFALIFALLIGIVLSICLIPSGKTATSDEKTTPSNCTVGNNVAISLSNNLTSGILFGSLQPATGYNNATGNYNSTSHTQYWITIDSTTTTYINLCIKDNANLTSGSYNIANDNYRYSYNKTTNNQTYPYYPGVTAMTQSYVYLADMNGSTATTMSYFRFTLNVSSGQQAGTYNNTVYLKGTENVSAC